MGKNTNTSVITTAMHPTVRNMQIDQVHLLPTVLFVVFPKLQYWPHGA